MGIASILGSYVYKASYDDLPQNVITDTKVRILDFLGTAFELYGRSPVEPVIRVLKAYDAREESTVIGEGTKLPCSFAAMVNSAYGISDGFRFSGAHPACVVIPAALAVSEARSRTKAVSGKELILATVLGYEVMLRIGRAMYPSAHMRGFSPSAIHGTIGAAAAASKILGLDKESTINVLSIASLMSHGLQAADRGPASLFSFQVGRASEAGVLCALVAQAGLNGSDEILEEGFFPAFSDEYHLDSIEKDLGKEYMLPKTYIKWHGGCRHVHAPIDASLYLRNTHNISWEDVEKIRVKTYQAAYSCLIKDPETGRQAEYCVEFAVSLPLVYGDASMERYADSNLKSEPIQQLMRKVTVEHDPGLDKDYPQKRPTIVEITTKSGKVFSHKLDLAKGEPENPLSKSEIENKFHYMASKVVNEETRRKIIDYVNRLETMEDITGLFPLLVCK